MAQLTKAKPHLTPDQVKKKIKTTKGFWKVQKWLVIYNALTKPDYAKNIAASTALSKSSVHKVIFEYNKYGEDAIETVGKGGRRRQNMTIEEESKLLKPFFKKAEKGIITTAKEIKKTYEEKIGKKVHKTTIYRLLNRHNWRKVVPRSYHPKKDKNKQEEFKKTSAIK